VPPLRLPRCLLPSQARGGWGAPAARLLAARLLAAALLVCAAAGAAPPAAAASGHWQQPVPGPVTRAFEYSGEPFAAGRHRGADFAARSGAPVRSACAGRVVFAGTAGSNGPTVSVRCGVWRVAYLPLRTLALRRGARVGRGTLLGTAAGSGRHGGLHVGVRREGSRWGYVDPLRFFGAAGQLPLAPPPRPVRPPPAGRPLPAAPPRPRPTPLHRPVEVSRSDPLRRPVAALAPDPARTNPLHRPVEAPARGPQSPVEEAPWPAWAGLAPVIAGACGAGLARRRRAHRLRPRAAVARLARE
jgi:murein DD-endopeptidase MepM/ murein hydrolase activator NlpD